MRAVERRSAFSSCSAWAPMSNGLNENVFWRVAVVAVGRASGRLAKMEADKQIYMRPGQFTLVGLQIEASVARPGGLMGDSEYVYTAWDPAMEFNPNTHHWDPARQAEPAVLRQRFARLPAE
eukprot:9338385-Alexandrium_andersonii.AAC.1